MNQKCTNIRQNGKIILSIWFMNVPDPQEEILRLSKQLQMTERRIERWLRQRALIGKPSQLDKFAETGWRWLYYTSIFIWGIKSLWSKTWLWNIRDCWYNYPFHYVESDVWWWYMAELGFYWGLIGKFYYSQDAFSFKNTAQNVQIFGKKLILEFFRSLGSLLRVGKGCKNV